VVLKYEKPLVYEAILPFFHPGYIFYKKYFEMRIVLAAVFIPEFFFQIIF
jgi:hypothetical protein